MDTIQWIILFGIVSPTLVIPIVLIWFWVSAWITYRREERIDRKNRYEQLMLLLLKHL